jgi:hypothetical protein
MKGKHGIWLLCLIVGAFVFSSLVVSAGAATEPLVNYDEWYDSGGAPDVRSVSLGDTEGIVYLTVAAPGLVSGESDVETVIDTMIDADRNTETGDVYGYEYIFEVGYDGALYAGVWHYTGEGWVEMTPTESMSFTAIGDEYTFAFAPADLDGTTGFDYSVVSAGWQADDGTVGVDFAPEEGVWSYWPLTTSTWEGGGAVAVLPDGTMYLGGDDFAWHQVDAATLAALGYGETPVTAYTTLPGQLGAPIAPIVVTAAVTTPTQAPLVKPSTTTLVPLTAVIAKPVAVPSKPVAGKMFTLRYNITRSDTGAKLLDATTTMTCKPMIGGKVLKHTDQLKNGVATLKVAIPKTATGKILSVFMTVKVGDQSLNRNLGFRVQ